MEDSPDSRKPKKQLNLRLSDVAFERLRAWAFLEDGQQPGAFAAQHIEAATEEAATAIPEIDELVRISAERRANEQ